MKGKDKKHVKKWKIEYKVVKTKFSEKQENTRKRKKKPQQTRKKKRETTKINDIYNKKHIFSNFQKKKLNFERNKNPHVLVERSPLPFPLQPHHSRNVRCIVGHCLLDDGDSGIGSFEMRCSFFHECLQVLDASCHIAHGVFNGHLSSHRIQPLGLLRYHEILTLRRIFLSQTFTSVNMSVASQHATHGDGTEGPRSDNHVCTSPSHCTRCPIATA